MRAGLIGCGRVAGQGHIPAYLKSGVQVSAVCDLAPERALRAAEQLRCDAEADALSLATRGDVDFIDVATPPDGRGELLRQLLAVGKPILCQKPLAYSVAEAQALVAAAGEAGVVLAVNHNARWAPNHQAVYRHLVGGSLGSVYAVAHHNRFNENLDSWYTRHPDYLFVDHGLHYFDLVRLITGRTPTAVSAVAGRAPGQLPAGPTVYSVHCRFADEDAPHVVLTFQNTVPSPDGFEYRLIVDGTEASVVASLSEVRRIPQPAAAAPPETTVDEVRGEWMPDGFVGSLQAFLAHVTQGAPLLHSGTDHLASLAFAESAARSARAAGEWVSLPLDAQTWGNSPWYTDLSRYL